MPLTFFEGNAANQIYAQGKALQSICFATQETFAVTTNPAIHTALSTSGAGSCIIMVIHKTMGCGALGHCAGISSTLDILRALDLMLQKIGGGQVENIVLAAGAGRPIAAQLAHQQQTVQALHAVYANAHISWPNHPEFDQGAYYDACYYLPVQQRIGLREGSLNPDYLSGLLLSPVPGIAIYDYAGRSLF